MNGNPQIEDGYIKIANELAEALSEIRISGEEWQVLWVILRKTYGWHKKEDWIPLNQFMEMTGINKPCIIRAIKKLEKKKIVIKKDNDKGKTYEFNKHYKEWQPLSKKITLSKKIISVIKKDNASLSKKIPSKTNTSITNISKEKVCASTPYLLAKKLYEIRGLNIRPIDIDMRNFKLLLQFYPEEMILKGIMWRLAHDPEGFYHKNLTSAMVYRQFGNWIAESSVKAISFQDWLAKNPEFDYQKFDDQLARADGFLIAFQKAKEAVKNRFVYFQESDYEMYRKAIRIKSKEVAKEVK